MGIVMGEGGSSNSRSAALSRDSTDCDEGTRSFGGGIRLNGGDGEFGWLKYW